jgi:dTDP-4-amino-4,6-dideoxygalactose transaminase
MTTGEGGMLVTENDDFARQARLLRTHGIVRQPTEFVGLGSSELDEWGSWYYEMQSLGYNYRITDFQCALGLSQLRRLDSMLQRRREIVATYNRAFGDCQYLTTPQLRNNLEQPHSAWHLYTLQVDFERLGVTRLEWVSALRADGIEAHVMYIPVHLQPWYRQTYGYGVGKCPHAEGLYQKAVCLPLFPAMCDDEVQLVISSVLKLCHPKSRPKSSRNR